LSFVAPFTDFSNPPGMLFLRRESVFNFLMAKKETSLSGDRGIEEELENLLQKSMPS
jgi:hypothetical protein